MTYFFNRPTAAFSAATRFLRNTFAFSAPVQEMMAHLATNTFTERPWVRYGETAPEDDKGWVCHDSNRAFVKAASVQRNGKINYTSIREKLASDLLYSLGTPVAACAFYQDGERTLILSGATKIATTLGTAASSLPLSDECDITEKRKRDMLERHAVLEDKPELVTPYMCLLAGHLWVGNPDCHSENMAISETGLYGYDFGLADPRQSVSTTLLRWHHPTTVSQFYDTSDAPALRAIFTAIENYPEKRLYTLAERLESFADDPVALAHDVEALVKKQSKVRKEFLRHLPARAAKDLRL